MTNEELAKLLAKVKYTAEHGVFDAAEKSMLADMEVVGTALQSLIATAREAEVLRARLHRLYTIILENSPDTTIADNGMTVWDGVLDIARRNHLENSRGD